MAIFGGRKWLFVTALLILVGGSLWVRQTSSQSALRSELPAPDSLLNIPLERTVLARQEFLAAYRTRDSRHARALYEQFLPRIGANGIGQSLQTAHPYCHEEGHELGKLILARLNDVGMSLESCADACTSGCMHGVLMQFFTKDRAMQGSGHQHSAQLSAADVAPQIPTFCESEALARKYLPGDCAHGVGHAVMFLSKYDVPAGIDLCERFPSYGLRYYCATGAYMEYWSNPRARWGNPTHPERSLCDKARYPAACFRYVVKKAAQLPFAQARTLAALERQCASLGGKYRLGCFHGIGFSQLLPVARGRTTVAKACGFGTREDQTICLEGAIERLGRFSPAIAAERCEQLADWRRGVCQAAASRKMYDMDKSFALYQR